VHVSKQDQAVLTDLVGVVAQLPVDTLALVMYDNPIVDDLSLEPALGGHRKNLWSFWSHVPQS